MIVKGKYGKRLTALLLGLMLGAAALAGCSGNAAGDAEQETETQTTVEDSATESTTESTIESTIGSGSEEAAAAMENSEEAQTAAASGTAAAAVERDSTITPEEAASLEEGAAYAKEQAGLESSALSSTGAAAVETLTEEELNDAFDNAKPFEGKVTAVVNTSEGKQIVLESEDGATWNGVEAPPLNGSGYYWTRITDAAASSTLYVEGYNYSVWNMLDWDTRTCWAEGNPYSEGTLQGFAYATEYGEKIDGCRIYPGYQKSSRVYRNNIAPLALDIEIGGCEIWCNLDEWIQPSIGDGQYYWIDLFFSRPVYSTGTIYVTIGAVKAFSANPDYDCCITEFHPFSF